MSNEMKRDVFNDALAYVPVGREYDPVSDDAAGDLRSSLSVRYAAAFPDDLPVIPAYVAEYIDDMKSKGKDIWDAIHYWRRMSDIDEYMEDNSETFARAWLDGYEIILTN